MAENTTQIADIIAQRAKKPVDVVMKSEDLFAEGLIDSFGILDLIAQLEEAFAVSISNDDLTWQNFRSVGQIAQLVSALKAK